MSLMTLPARPAGDTEVNLDAMVTVTAGGLGGFVFDYYAPTDFKYVTLDLAAGQAAVGHRTKNQWVTDATFAAALSAGIDYKIAVTLNGTSVAVSLNGVQLGSFSYYGAVADGGIGTISRTGMMLVDNLHEVIGSHVDTSPDSAPPTITMPADVSRSAEPGKPTAVVSDATLGTATASDNVALDSLTRCRRARRERLPDRRHDRQLDGHGCLRQPDRHDPEGHDPGHREAGARGPARIEPPGRRNRHLRDDHRRRARRCHGDGQLRLRHGRPVGRPAPATSSRSARPPSPTPPRTRPAT